MKPNRTKIKTKRLVSPDLLYSLSKAELHPVLPNLRLTKGKDIERSIIKCSPQSKCYKCQGYGHIAVKCASPYKITLIDREGYPESEGDEYIHQVNGDEEDFDENTEKIMLSYFRLRESTRLSVVRYTLAQPKVSDDWIHTNIFHTFTKIGERSCMMIVDSGSYINAVSLMIINKIYLKAEPHSHPYKVSWINKTALNVTQRCLVLIEFIVYKDKIWCDVVTIVWAKFSLEDPGYLIICSHLLSYEYVLFLHEHKKVKLLSSQSKNNVAEKKSVAVKQTKISLISAKDIDCEIMIDREKRLKSKK